MHFALSGACLPGRRWVEQLRMCLPAREQQWMCLTASPAATARFAKPGPWAHFPEQHRRVQERRFATAENHLARASALGFEQRLLGLPELKGRDWLPP